jgi:ATP-dependent RNA helicase DDX31/DBP7
MIFNFEVPTPSATNASDNNNIQKERKKEKQQRHERLKRKRKQRMEERKQKKNQKSNKFNKNESHFGNKKDKHSSEKNVITKNNQNNSHRKEVLPKEHRQGVDVNNKVVEFGPVNNSLRKQDHNEANNSSKTVTNPKIVITKNNFHFKKDSEKNTSKTSSISSIYGSRKKPKSVKRSELLDSARSALKHVKKSQNPIQSQPSDHLFENASPWIDLGIDKRLIRHVEAEKSEKGLGLKQPTMVQTMSIPTILTHKHDVVIKSETGSGKTLTYLLPIAQVLSSLSPRICRKDGTLALILLPTRELGTQVLNVAQKLFRPFPWIVPGMICGGEKPKAEKARLRKGLSVLVATPGRLLYHLNSTQSFVTMGMQFLVLDEADRMMDQGFEQQLKDVFEILHYKKASEDSYNYRGSIKPWRTILVSATQKANVTSLCGVDLVEPKFIDAATKKSCDLLKSYNTPKQLSQHVVLLDSAQKLVALLGFIRHRFREAKKLPMKMQKCHLLIFFSTCASVDFHYHLFNKSSLVAANANTSNDSGNRHNKKKSHDRNRNLPNAKNIIQSLSNRVHRLHGNIEQKERNQTLQAFSKSDFGVLLCTDVAARGLDIPNVDWIVQYDAPSETTEYVHRVGRTARSGKAGSALLFLRPCEASFIKYLESFKLNLTQVSSISVLGGLCDDSQGVIGGSRRGEVAKERANECQIFFERMTANSENLKSLASKAFQSWVGSYSCREKSTRSIFNVRMLHLGHIAKSFSLRDAPSSIGKKSSAGKGGSTRR